MESLYLLIPLSVVIAIAIGVVFWWTVRSGQFDDLEGPGHRILHDEDQSSRSPPNGDSGQNIQD
ncbi:cbb3-type cytochrome oxidase assembly protein CcoS [Chitinibacteraceae bacterium HSL-7]